MTMLKRWVAFVGALFVLYLAVALSIGALAVAGIALWTHPTLFVGVLIGFVVPSIANVVRSVGAEAVEGSVGAAPFIARSALTILRVGLGGTGMRRHGTAHL